VLSSVGLNQRRQRVKRLAGWVLGIAATAAFGVSAYLVVGQGSSCGDYGEPQCSAQTAVATFGFIVGLPLLIGAAFAGAKWPLATAPLASGGGLLAFAGRHPGHAVAETWVGVALVAGAAVAAVAIWNASHQDGRRARFVEKAASVHGVIAQLRFRGYTGADRNRRYKRRYRMAVSYQDAGGGHVEMVRTVAMPDNETPRVGAEVTMWYHPIWRRRTVVRLSPGSPGGPGGPVSRGGADTPRPGTARPASP
jgi:hypothetical protein